MQDMRLKMSETGDRRRNLNPSLNLNLNINLNLKLSLNLNLPYSTIPLFQLSIFPS
jgi:hypothetical protein